jgi:hypothetical protein
MISDNVLRYCGGHFENGDRWKFFNSGHHYLPTYQILMISDNVKFLRYNVVAILKMATGRNFSMSGHHYLPTYQILMISDNVELLLPIFYAVFLRLF